MSFIIRKQITLCPTHSHSFNIINMSIRISDKSMWKVFSAWRTVAGIYCRNEWRVQNNWVVTFDPFKLLQLDIRVHSFIINLYMYVKRRGVLQLMTNYNPLLSRIIAHNQATTGYTHRNIMMRRRRSNRTTLSSLFKLKSDVFPFFTADYPLLHYRVWTKNIENKRNKK